MRRIAVFIGLSLAIFVVGSARASMGFVGGIMECQEFSVIRSKSEDLICFLDLKSSEGESFLKVRTDIQKNKCSSVGPKVFGTIQSWRDSRNKGMAQTHFESVPQKDCKSTFKPSK